jgi:hypothetical protein
MHYTYQTLTVRPVFKSEATVSVMLLTAAVHASVPHSGLLPTAGSGQALCTRQESWVTDRDSRNCKHVPRPTNTGVYTPLFVGHARHDRQTERRMHIHAATQCTHSACTDQPLIQMAPHFKFKCAYNHIIITQTKATHKQVRTQILVRACTQMCVTLTSLRSSRPHPHRW